MWSSCDSLCHAKCPFTSNLNCGYCFMQCVNNSTKEVLPPNLKYEYDQLQILSFKINDIQVLLGKMKTLADNTSKGIICKPF